jgi:hypothetical protein
MHTRSSRYASCVLSRWSRSSDHSGRCCCAMSRHMCAMVIRQLTDTAEHQTPQRGHRRGEGGGANVWCCTDAQCAAEAASERFVHDRHLPQPLVPLTATHLWRCHAPAVVAARLAAAHGLFEWRLKHAPANAQARTLALAAMAAARAGGAEAAGDAYVRWFRAENIAAERRVGAKADDDGTVDDAEAVAAAIGAFTTARAKAAMRGDQWCEDRTAEAPRDDDDADSGDWRNAAVRGLRERCVRAMCAVWGATAVSREAVAASAVRANATRASGAWSGRADDDLKAHAAERGTTDATSADEQLAWEVLEAQLNDLPTPTRPRDPRAGDSARASAPAERASERRREHKERAPSPPPAAAAARTPRESDARDGDDDGDDGVVVDDDDDDDDEAAVLGVAALSDGDSDSDDPPPRPPARADDGGERKSGAPSATPPPSPPQSPRPPRSDPHRAHAAMAAVQSPARGRAHLRRAASSSSARAVGVGSHALLLAVLAVAALACALATAAPTTAATRTAASTSAASDGGSTRATAAAAHARGAGDAYATTRRLGGSAECAASGGPPLSAAASSAPASTASAWRSPPARAASRDRPLPRDPRGVPAGIGV